MVVVLVKNNERKQEEEGKKLFNIEKYMRKNMHILRWEK